MRTCIAFDALMDEVFGDENFVALIAFAKTSGSTRDFLGGSFDYLLLSREDKDHLKFRMVFKPKEVGGAGSSGYTYVQSRTDRFGRHRRMT